MDTFTSRDSTKIAFDKQGDGPALILINGALSTRSGSSRTELKQLLSKDFTVYGYDRRGRGDSGDTPPYAVAREIADIDTLIDLAGGSAFLYGHSSGGCLALEATVAIGGKVKKLAIYEAPYNDDPAVRNLWRDYLKGLRAALDSGRNGDAVALFMAYVGVPDERIQEMRQAPFWEDMEAIAPTLAYDHAEIMGDGTIPVERAARVGVPTLLVAGGNGAPFMLDTATRLAKIIPNGALAVLDGQSHDVQPGAIAPVLIEFLLHGRVPSGVTSALAGRA